MKRHVSRTVLILALAVLSACMYARKNTTSTTTSSPAPAAPRPEPQAIAPTQPPPESSVGAPRAKAALAAPMELRSLAYLSSRGDEEFVTEAYDRIHDNVFLAAATNPLSTFSIDVDTASYANVRRFLAGGRLPPKDAVRTEELLNYFRYDYPEPIGDKPFSVTTEQGSCPWRAEHRLVRIGLRGRSIDQESVPPRNLVFLLDVSGSMMPANKLPLLKAAMGLLVEQLRPQDRVGIVVYAGAAGLVLHSTPGSAKDTVREALNALEAGGTTAGGAGIQLAYQIAGEAFIDGGINRVILATDGDFNVGITSQGDLLRLIEEKRETGVFLSVLGFGEGNLKDSTMEKLADAGNGNYSYIDTLAEARKVLVAEAGATLVTLGKDVKIQVEWNPARVEGYRLIGFENRLLKAEDFNDDSKDAGEIGAGHTVTALYEVAPKGVALELPGVDPLKYQAPPALNSGSDDLATVKLRYKQPDGDVSRLISVVVKDGSPKQASADLRFASAVVEFAMLLRGSVFRGSASYEQALELARGALAVDPSGLRSQFVELLQSARRLSGPPHMAQVR